MTVKLYLVKVKFKICLQLRMDAYVRGRGFSVQFYGSVCVFVLARLNQSVKYFNFSLP